MVIVNGMKMEINHVVSLSISVQTYPISLIKNVTNNQVINVLLII